MAEAMPDSMEEAAQAAGEMIESMPDDMGEMAEAMPDSMEEAAETAGEMMESMPDDMGEMAEAMPDSMEEAAETAGEMMESMPDSMAEAAQDIAEEMADSMPSGMSGMMGMMMGMMSPSTPLPACTDRPLTVLPLTQEKILGVVPLGHLKPPEHTQPTDHIYLSIPGYLQLLAPSVNLYSAGNGRVTRVSRTDYDQDGNTWSDWNLTIGVCDGREIRYGHVSTVSSAIQEASNASRTGRCDTYGYGTNQYQYCSADVSVDVVAGDLLGTVGGLDTTNTQLDMWAYDNEMAPLAFINSAAQPSDAKQVVCPLDWFTEDLSQFLYGIRRETHLGAPFPADSAVGCGKTLNDVAGTAKGLWYSATEAGETWQDQLALVDDNTRSDRQAISVASTVADPGFWLFVAASSGTVNRDFAQVQAGSGIHCYSSFTVESSGVQASSDRFLIEVVDDDTLRIERQTGSCSGSLAFSSPFEYRRS